MSDEKHELDNLDPADKPGLPAIVDDEVDIPSPRHIHERNALDADEKLSVPEILEVYALRLHGLQGKSIGKKLAKRQLNAEQIRLWQRLSLVPGLMLQDRLISQALHGVKHECRRCEGTGQVTKKGPDGLVEIECLRCKGKGWIKGDPDPRLVKLAHDAAMDMKDRTIGKATEHVQIASAVKVVMGGIDFGKFPQPEKEAEVIDQEEED